MNNIAKYKSVVTLTCGVFLLICGISTVFARSNPDDLPQQQQPVAEDKGPWFTGPLLAGSGHTVPAGHLNLEPTLLVTDAYGTFSGLTSVTSMPMAWSVAPVIVFTYGVNNWLDVQGIVGYTVNNIQNSLTGARVQAQGPADMSATLGFQVLTDKPGTYMPDLRVTLSETFPTGFFSNFSDAKLGAEGTGAGSYQTTLGFNFQKLYQFYDKKYLRTRLVFAYTVPTDANVNGFNAYGGAANTHGKIDPGNKFFSDLAFEYTLTQNWVPAIDITYSNNQKSSFKGFPGTTVLGLPASIGYPNGSLVTLAPALEYNFSSRVGIIGGAWFSVLGQNKVSFASAVIAINLYYSCNPPQLRLS